jgi:hypothetical protein
MGGFAPQALALLPWALSELGAAPPAEWTAAYFGAATPALPTWSPGLAASALLGCARLQLAPPPAFMEGFYAASAAA